jgi:hypothetical protein
LDTVPKQPKSASNINKIKTAIKQPPLEKHVPTRTGVRIKKTTKRIRMRTGTGTGPEDFPDPEAAVKIKRKAVIRNRIKARNRIRIKNGSRA